MAVGNLVRVKNNSMLAPGSENIGMVVDIWLINDIKWLRVLWDTGSVDAIVDLDVEVIQE